MSFIYCSFLLQFLESYDFLESLLSTPNSYSFSFSVMNGRDFRRRTVFFRTVFLSILNTDFGQFEIGQFSAFQLYPTVQTLCHNSFFLVWSFNIKATRMHNTCFWSSILSWGALEAGLLIFSSTWARSSTTGAWSRWPCAYRNTVFDSTEREREWEWEWEREREREERKREREISFLKL